MSEGFGWNRIFLSDSGCSIESFFYIVLPSRAGFKPILPISSNRAPRQRGPALCFSPTQIYTFYRSCLCTVTPRNPLFFKVFWHTKKLPIFLTVTQNIVETRFTTIISVHQNIALQSSRYSWWKLRFLKMSLQSASSNLKKTLEGVTVFY